MVSVLKGNYRVVNNDRVSELFSFAIWQLGMVRIVRNVHNDRRSARNPEAYRCEHCVQSELSDIMLSAKNNELGYSIIINNSVKVTYQSLVYVQNYNKLYKVIFVQESEYLT